MAESAAKPGLAGQEAPLRGHHADAQPLSYIRQADASVGVGKAFKPRRIKTPLDRIARRGAGKRSYTVSKRKRGRYSYARAAHDRRDDIAFDATFRQAAPYQIHRDHAARAVAIEDVDLQRKVRLRKASNLIVFVVDASWSMAAAERMEATKGAIFSLLMDAYQKRDRVCLITFRKDGAELVLNPTSRVEMAQQALKDIPVGGKTPLSAGLLLAYQTIEREKRQDPEVMPLLILLTDGAGNVPVTGMPPREEALVLASYIAQKHIHAAVINTEHETLDRGLAQELANALGAPCHTLGELKAEALYQTVRQELQG